MSVQAAQLTEIAAEIERVTYRNDDNGWTVVKARNSETNQSFTAVGHFPDIHPGEVLQLYGDWAHHQSYGAQFRVERYTPTRPGNRAAIERYLGSGIIKGIGPKTASRIVEHFGKSTLDILDQQPNRLSEVPNIGKKRCREIIDAWQTHQALHNVMLFLHGHGISTLFAHKIFKAYGQNAIKVVSENPYHLATDIHGIGFLTADKIAMSLGIAADSHARIQAAVLYQLKAAEDRGHCFLTLTQLRSDLQHTLQLSEETILEKIEECLRVLSDAGVVLQQNVIGRHGQERAVYLQDLLVCELNIADQIASRSMETFSVDVERVNAWISKYADASATQLSDQQLNAVLQAAKNRLFVLTGGPGVGKTTTANTIIRLLRAMGRNVALCAPTGRAAQRLSEVSALPAKTIHRMLEWLPHEGSFARNEHNPLTAQTIICDEASMLDIRLADALLRAVAPNAQIIFIGDVDQLPSVGPGRFLADLIDSHKVPFTRLDQVFRQAGSSRIVQTAHCINRGEAPEFSPDPASDCLFYEIESPAAIREQVCKLISEVIPNRFNFDPMQDIQVLTPMNRGDLGTQALNLELQSILNPKLRDMHEFKRGQFHLRPGDRVIQMANNYELNVFNGDIGFIEAAMVDDGKVIVNFGDRIVSYEDDAILDLRLAYAITIHKSQGSEFPAVIIPVSMQHYIMLQRNLIYTALTRAKKLAIFVGTSKALRYAAKNLQSQHRQTYLIDRIHQEMMS